MAILERVMTLVRANINDLLDKAEDPEKMLDQIIRDMGEEIGRAKTQVAETIAQKNLVESSYENSNKLSAEWNQKAELAVQKGRDDLGREALRRKRDYEANARVYQEQLAAQQETVNKLKSALTALQSKYEEVVRNREVLVARYKSAQAKRKVVTASASMAQIDPTSELRRMEEKIRLEEARANALEEVNSTSLENQFDQLDDDGDELDAELQELKQRVGQSGQPI